MRWTFYLFWNYVMKHISKLTYLLWLPALIWLSLLYSMNVALGDISISIPSSMDLHRPQLWKLVLGSTWTPTVVEVKTWKNVLSIRNWLVMWLDNASLSGAKYVSIGWWINNVISSIESSGIWWWKGNFIDSPVSVIWWWAENVVKSSSKYSTVAWWHSNVVDFEWSIVGWENNVVIGRSVVVWWRDNYVEGEGSMVLWSSSQWWAKSFSWNSPIVRDYSAIIVANAWVLIWTYYPVTWVNLVVEGAVKIWNGSLTGNIWEIRLQSGCFYGYDGSDWHVVNKKPWEWCPKVTCTYGSVLLHPGDSVQAYTQPYSMDCSQTLRTANCYADWTFWEPGVQYYAYCYDLSGGIWHDEEVAACGAADGKVYVNSPTPSDWLCENGDSWEIDTQNTLFAWQCSIWTSVANCSATRVYSCEGDQPTWPWLIMWDTTQMYSDTLKSWTPVAQGVLPWTCQWTCAEWYEQQTNGCSWDIIIESSECGTYNPSAFKDLDMYFITDSWTTWHYTLMDRNLWATQVYVWIDNICTYWYYYQWWNNYWFPNEWSVTTSSTPVDASTFGPLNYYSSSTFITTSSWDSSNNKNLWWWVSGTNDAMRWPCPDDYHVPSKDEFVDIVDNYWKKSVDNVVGYELSLDFLMPFAGIRQLVSSSFYEIGNYGIYRSSTASDAENRVSYNLGFYNNTSNTMILPSHVGGRGTGSPVRCFKNSSTPSLIIHPNEWKKALIIVHDNKITKLWTPTKDWKTFWWWYSDSSFTPDSQVRTWDTVLAWTHLYAKWESSEWCTEAQDITICNPENSSECLTIMDRNLWACVAGTGEESYGNYYQWWNNYGFHYSLWNNVPVETVWLTWDDSYNNNWYLSESWINVLADVWSGGRHYNGVWWWAGDNESNWRWVLLNNPTERQWPCPLYYHVPSIGEWWLLVKYWKDTYATGVTLSGSNNLYNFSDGAAIANFQTYFKLPFAGSREYSDAHLNLQGSYGDYWSSSPNGSRYTYNFAMDEPLSYVNTIGYRSRAFGFSVRCFKNN